MLFRIVGRIRPRMCSLVGAADRPMIRGSFVGRYEADNYDKLEICGVAVRECMKRSSCHLGWSVGLGQGTV